MESVKDKYYWVTGASSGIGRELAIQLSRKGAKLALTSRTKEKLNQVLNELEGEGHQVFSADLMNAEALPSLVEEVMTWCQGDLYGLVNNAGISHRSLVKDTEIQVYRDIMELDYFVPVQLSKLVLPYLVKNKKGQLLNIVSVSGKIGIPGRSAYNGAKHALLGFMDSARAEYYDDNIKVLNILPGYVQTNVSLNALNGDGSSYGKMDEAISTGLTVEVCVAKIIRSIEKEKKEVIISKYKEISAAYLKRLSPSLLFYLIRKVRTS